MKPSADEASQLTLSVQNKMKAMQQTQRTVGHVVEGPTTKKLVEEVRQATTQGTIYQQVLKIDFSDLQENIEVPPAK